MLRTKGKLTLITSFCLILVLLTMTMIGCSKQTTTTTQQGSVTPEKPIELKLNMNFNATSFPIGRSFQYFTEQVEKRTNGRVKITRFGMGTLTPQDKIADSVLTGIADIGAVYPGYTPGRFPATDAGYLPYSFDSAWSLNHAVYDWSQKFQLKEFDEYKILFWVTTGNANLASNKPIRKPEDLKGMKVRVSGIGGANYIKALGGTPVSLPMSEAYEGISKGIVDALLVTMEPLQSNKLGDVIKYITKFPVTYGGPGPVVMNKKAYDSLPADIKKIFNEVCAEQNDVAAKAMWYADINGEQYFNSLGGGREVIEVPAAEVNDWAKLVTPLTNDYITSATAKGLPAQDYVNYLKERTEYYGKQPHDQKEVLDWVEKNIPKK